MKIRVFEAFAGYGSQAMALKRLQRDFPDKVEFEFVGISEIDNYAIAAYKAVHGGTPNFGDISAIDWAQVPDFDLFTYSFPCFVAGTLVHTERGYIPIEEVAKDDMVLTHTNQYQKVRAVGKRDNAPIIKVHGMCFKDILCTPNHPFYVRKRYRYGHNSERRFAAPEWLAASKLTRDHYIGYAINQKAELPKWDGIIATRWKNVVNKLTPLFNNTDFWYVMGRYVGDGWKKTSKTGSGIVICCSERNRETLLASMRAIGWRLTISEDRTVTKEIINSNELHAFVDRYGYKADGKFIDNETLNLPIDLLKAFVEGYVDADGCYTLNEFKATSVSEKLMYGLQQCISKVYRCPVRMYWFHRPATATIEGRTVNQRDSYSIVWHPERRKQDKAFYEDGYVWFPIKEIVDLDTTATVYNMEVENDSSYTANGAIVHNCQDISTAGKQRGFNEGSGSRSSLLWECRRTIEVKRPKYLLMENVKALVQKKFMPEFQRWIDTLSELGYTSFWQVLNAKDYGVPQNRERVFMVSIIGEATFEFPKPFPLEKRLRDVLEENVPEEYYLRPEQVERILAHTEKHKERGNGFSHKFEDGGGISGTILTAYGSRPTDTMLKVNETDNSD